MSENAQWTKDVKQRGLGAEGSQAGRPPTDVPECCTTSIRWSITMGVPFAHQRSRIHPAHCRWTLY